MGFRYKLQGENKNSLELIVVDFKGYSNFYYKIYCEYIGEINNYLKQVVIILLCVYMFLTFSCVEKVLV